LDWIDAVDFVDGVEMQLQLFEKWGSYKINLRRNSELCSKWIFIKKKLFKINFFIFFYCFNVLMLK
jgi:hypothetical protein